jgi:hypothetical protein
MSFNVRTYSPNQVMVVVAGFQIEGWNTISISKSSRSFQLVKGIRGGNTRIRSVDNSLSLVVEVQQTSLTNDVFSEIVRQDKEFNTGKLQVSIKDLSGKTFIQSQNCFIEDYAPLNFADAAGTRTWLIHFLDYDEYTTGSSESNSLKLFEPIFDTVGKYVDSIEESLF